MRPSRAAPSPRSGLPRARSSRSRASAVPGRVPATRFSGGIPTLPFDRASRGATSNTSRGFRRTLDCDLRGGFLSSVEDSLRGRRFRAYDAARGRLHWPAPDTPRRWLLALWLRQPTEVETDPYGLSVPTSTPTASSQVKSLENEDGARRSAMASASHRDGDRSRVTTVFDDIQITVDTDSLAFANGALPGSSHITGTISIEVNGVPIPELSSNDSLDRLLTYWSDKCRYLRSGGKTADFLFLDDPIGFFAICDECRCSIDFYRRIGSHRQILLSATCSLDALSASIARCAKQVWNAIVRHGWSSDCLTALEDAWRQR